MARYGCTCTTPIVCTACVLSWFDSNNTGANSFNCWSCPVCRGRPNQPASHVISERRTAAASSVAVRSQHAEQTMIAMFISVIGAIVGICMFTFLCYFTATHEMHQLSTFVSLPKNPEPKPTGLCTVANNCVPVHIMPNIIYNTTSTDRRHYRVPQSRNDLLFEPSY